MSDRIVAQATELMRSGCPEGAAFYWAAILVGMRAALERRGNWRHAKWCSWERGAEADCNCGLDEVRAALALPTPHRFIGPGEGHQHVGPQGTVSCYASHPETPHDLVPRPAPPAYRAPLVDGEPCYWCDPANGPCRIHEQAGRAALTCANCGQKMVVGIGPFALETAECAKCGHGRGHHDGQRCWVYLEQKPHRCHCDGKFKESLP